MSGTQERWWCNSSPAGRLETRKADVSICVQNLESSHSTCLDRKFPLTHGKVNLCSFQALSWLDGATYINRCSYKMGLSSVPELKPIWTLKQDSMLLVFQIEEQYVPRNTMNAALEAGKAWKWDFSFWSHWTDYRLANTLISAQWNLFGFFASRTIKE